MRWSRFTLIELSTGSLYAPSDPSTIPVRDQPYISGVRSIHSFGSGRHRFTSGQSASPDRLPSGLGTAALLVDLHLVLDAVVQLKVVVLQRGGAAGRQAVVGAGAVEQEPGTNRSQQNAQGTHDDDGDQDGIKGVQPVVVLLWDPRHWRFSWGVGCGPDREREPWKQTNQYIFYGIYIIYFSVIELLNASTLKTSFAHIK